MTRVCAISFKECWQDESGAWWSDGGFPLQMEAVASLFDEMTLLITRRREPGVGGLRLPARAEIIEVFNPPGRNWRRKLSVLAHTPYFIRTLAHHIRRADAVHVPPPGDIPLLGMMVALAMRKPLIVRYCCSWQSNSVTTMTNRFTRQLMRQFAGGRNVMLATGEEKQPPAPNVHWIFATALSKEELSRVKPDLDRGLGNPPVIAFIGRLSPEKGLKNLIQVLHQLQTSGFQPMPRVEIIGSGPQRAELDALARERGVDGRIHFHGQLNRAALSQALLGADFCLQPSLTEGYSKAWLDALAHGLPILGSEAGAARHVIGADGERGWLVAPGDVAGLDARLREVLTRVNDWPGLRRRCRAFADSRTLDGWAAAIGRQCVDQWGGKLEKGRLDLTGAKFGAA